MKRLDKIIMAAIVVLLILSMLAAGVVTLAKTNNKNENIVIKVNNKVEKNIPLNNSNESKIYKFNFNNNIGYVEVKNGRVRMMEMDKKICPKAICSDTGWIDKTYQIIACVPNNIVVTIEGNKDEFINSKTY